MCDNDENYLTILNMYIPDILKNLTLDYVVKGGRSFDYYLYLKNNEKMIYLTDWDIACYPENIEQIKNIIMSYIMKKTSLNLITEKIISNDNKKGIQIGIPNNCFFIDLFGYDKNDKIFENIEIGDDNIKYINKKYMLNDLENTYLDRKKNISEELANFGFEQFNFKSLDDDLSNIHSTLLKNIIEKQSSDKEENETEYNSGKIDKEEYEDYKKELDERIIQFVGSLQNEAMPKIKNDLSKFYRTENRYKKYKKLHDISGGKKITKITRKFKKNFRKRKTTKKRKRNY